MKIKLIIAGFILIILVFSTLVVYLFLKESNLKAKLTQSQELTQNIQEELARVTKEKEKLVKETNNFESNVVSYMALNTKFQTENDELREEIKKLDRDIETKKVKITDIERRLQGTKTLMQEKEEKKVGSLVKEKKKLEKENSILKSTFKREKAFYYYNLAVAYTEAEFYNEAIAAYRETLELYPDSADAHYNLGLLYENIKYDTDGAISHYREYLTLKPDADDTKEIIAWIENLEEDIR